MASAPPSESPSGSPSEKKPVLVLLESYVLSVIGQLPRAQEEAARRTVRQIAGPGAWPERLRELFGLESGVDDQIRAMWTSAQSIAEEAGQSLSASEFAEVLVEQNFGEAAEMVATELESSGSSRRKAERPSHESRSSRGASSSGEARSSAAPRSNTERSRPKER